ncbi:hypothetical protein WN51_11380 [Melipona quadrifasciata]|uniref:CUB domain-containing protein n=1 Tax=Melipona quadrifasciata TaxID=166423 RepID=A0A0M9A966_9HYME|nr:hypothetical protein WN51_11380 [Melipona quadrifasciata]
MKNLIHAQTLKRNGKTSPKETSGVSEYTPWSGVLCGDLHDIPQVLYSSRSTLILELHTQGPPSNATGFFGNFHFINRRESLDYNI